MNGVPSSTQSTRRHSFLRRTPSLYEDAVAHPEPFMEVKLIVASGRAKGRAIPLPETMFVIGRGQQCHLRPHCRLVSKLHCAIACWAGKVVVRDLKSSNGTFINGTRVRVEARVQNGDLLQVGTLQFVFEVQANRGAQLPVRVVHPGDVHWLIYAADGSSVLKTSDTYSDQPLSDLFELASPGDRGTDAKADISAGDYLRDYLRKRR